MLPRVKNNNNYYYYYYYYYKVHLQGAKCQHADAESEFSTITQP